MFKSASGYQSIDNTPLARLGYYHKIMGIVFEKDWLPLITNGEIDERVVQANSKVQLLRQPKVGKWRKYELNQQIIADQIAAEGLTLEIDQAVYKAIKIDNHSIRQACERWASWEASFLDSCYETLTQQWREWVISAMIVQTASSNKGNNAGKYKTMALGQYGAPFTITAKTIVDGLSRLKVTLKQTLRWEEDKMFLILPTEALTVIAASDFANVAWVGDQQFGAIGISGLLPKKLMGFTVIETPSAPMVNDSTGSVCFYIMAGHKDAFAFVGDLVEGRLVKPTDSFSQQYQMQAVYGGKALWEDALVCGYWTFK